MTGPFVRLTGTGPRERGEVWVNAARIRHARRNGEGAWIDRGGDDALSAAEPLETVVATIRAGLKDR